jgi:ATP-dependent Clp protease ATP-binding subunit ClpB
MLQARLEQLLKKIPSVQGQNQPDHVRRNGPCHRQGSAVADAMHDEYISTEHLLLGIVEESDDDVQQLCREFGLVKDKIMSTIKANRKAERQQR